MKSIKSDYDTDVMYDIAKVVGKIQIYVSHHLVDLSTELIPNDGSLEEAYAGVIYEETKIKQQESLSYGLHTLLMTQEADIRTTYNLRTTRDELLRSIAEKQKFIGNCMMCIVGNHIVHTLETVVCDVARMVEIRMGSDGKFVTRIGFVRTFVMGIGYDMMVAMVAHRVHHGCRKVVAHMLDIF
ncbi:hypothetical protein Tco_0105395 [Tanacetum coccineum]